MTDLPGSVHRGKGIALFPCDCDHETFQISSDVTADQAMVSNCAA